MHIIVKEFVETNDRLTFILERNFNQDQYLETVFLKFCHKMNKGKPEQQLYLDLDKAIISGHSDESVYLLFISFAAIFACHHDQPEKANVLISVGESVALEKIHPALQSYYMVAKGTLKNYEYKKDEGDILFKKALAIIKITSPRYKLILVSIATMLAMDGRLNELSKSELTSLEVIDNDNYALVYVNLKVTNCILIGNIAEAQSLMEENKKSLQSMSPRFIQILIYLSRLMSGDFNEKNYHDYFFKTLTNAYLAIVSGHMDDAVKCAQFIQVSKEKNEINFVFGTYLSFLSLHVELCLKNKGMVRLMLQEKAKENKTHFLDDFFLARLQLLEMNKEGAINSFRRLMSNVKKYDAMNRLLFEMQFAKEMNPSDILMLTNSVNDKININTEIFGDVLLTNSIKQEKGIQLLIGDSLPIIKVKELVLKFASLKEPVLIIGETGTGKELVSRAIHDEGPNSDEPFLAINCGSLTESLLQSELFGYVAGAFTGALKERKGIFEAAGKGTVFLDEFGDISPKLQVSLLRVLESNEIRLIGSTQSRKIECKIVIASNIDLRQAVEQKMFREDLYFRLTRFDIKLPPLRERKEDLSKLINYFLEDIKLAANKQKRVSVELLHALSIYHWPGNIRELKNEIERLKILYSDKEILSSEDFDFSRLQDFKPKISKQENNILEKELGLSKNLKKRRNVDDENVTKILNRGSKIEQRHQFLKELFYKYKKLTRSQIIEVAEISTLTATKDLQFLCKAGVIKKITPTKSVRSNYFILAE